MSVQKTIYLPTYAVACEASEASEKSIKVYVIVPDASSASIANAIGANLAPGLLNVDRNNIQPLFFLLGPNTPAQLPVVRDCPSAPFQFNTNFNYTPIMRVVVLNRNTLPPNTTVNTDDLIYLLLNEGVLTIDDDSHRINAPVAPRVAG